LDTDFATIQWVVVSYIMVVTSLLLAVSRLGDMLGKKRIFNLGLVIFTGGSLLCGLAPSAGWLVAFRAVQGVGAAMSQALGLAIVAEAAPPAHQGRAIGIIGATVSLGLSLGPSLGGVLLGLFGWRSIFLVNAPLGVVAWMLMQRHAPDFAPAESGQRFDAPGALVLFAALGSFCLGMTRGQDLGFGQVSVLLPLAGAGLGMLLFLAVEASSRQPMVDLSLFRNPLFSLNLAMGVLCFISLSGMFILPFYLELVQARDPVVMGLLMMAAPLSMGAASPLAGSLTDRFGPRVITIVGLVIMIGGCLAVSTLQADTPWWGFVLRAAPLGLGIGCFQAPNNSAIMGQAPRNRLGVASGLLNASRTLGQTTGIPLAGSVFTAFVLAHSRLAGGADLGLAPVDALVTAVRGTYLVNAGFMALTLCLAVAAYVVDRRRKR
ncbi:MAG: MFS transporter, partial [Desulfovibrionaceae bacterium]